MTIFLSLFSQNTGPIENRGPSNSNSDIAQHEDVPVVDSSGIVVEEPTSVMLLPLNVQHDGAQGTTRMYYIRAMLGQVIVQVNSAKYALSEYYMVTGKLASGTDSAGLSNLDLEEHDLIDDYYVSSKGGIGVVLSSVFGSDRLIVWEPKISTNGHILKWECESNVAEKYLGFSQPKFCKYNSGLSRTLYTE